jgi:hypothetical protein
MLPANCCFCLLYYQLQIFVDAGIKEVGGATIVYRTRQLRDANSWRYDGLLCVGDGGTGWCRCNMHTARRCAY